ncbi:UDP-N-acetylmuramoyl-L-alanyl-D-glutamate--2,6-diaminopimelate ligase [Pelagibacteraceae bacterium]|nr:UDP-N-acetylmuramoyl-L-alanyl-D-glutamate--2,6-diaminopimelate ligase [Pelagibacteraceae bacterium]
MLLKKIIKNLPLNIQNINIAGLSQDSREVKKNYLFFAVKGSQFNGERYISDAILKGAIVVICSHKCKIKKSKVPIIKVKNITTAISHACKIFYSKKPTNIIAVTGTNGKSSVAEFYHQLLTIQKIPVASIGTLGIKIKEKIKKTNLTTLDIISLHRELSEIKKQGVNNVILEASSHGLLQGRLNGLQFKTGIFTNFSQDHLDYHKNMKNYLQAKLILFSKLLKKKQNIITDSQIKEFKKLKLISKKRNLKLITIGIKNSTIKINSLIPKSNFQQLSFKHNKKNYIIDIPLIGVFQIKNLLMSILAAKLSGLNLIKILKNIKNIKEVNGRLQLIKILPNNTKVFVDYAHTPDALESSLKTLKAHYGSKPDLVFGCGGERDKKKRIIMAKISEKNADNIYITDDNPRNENPRSIRKMIISGFKKKKGIHNISLRGQAISSAIINSEPNGTVLVAGKGHEMTQVYKKKVLNFSDEKIIKKINIKKIKYSKKNYNQIVNAKIINELLKKDNIKFEGVTIDSKKVKKGNLFIAIKGKNHDGHLFTREALKKKASFCVVKKYIKKIDQNKLIRCSNTINFLNKLAVKKREYSKAKIIAVTGSSGKTSSKNLLGNLLTNYGQTYFSKKSHNNHFGVPLSLCNLEDNHQYGVFEIGMSKPEEIRNLSNLVRPHIGVITNIGEAHIENFDNLNGIAKAKSEIIENINKDGFLILNRDDKYFNFLSKIAKTKKIKVLSFGTTKKSDAYLIQNKKFKNYNLLRFKVFKDNISLKTKNTNSLTILNILSSFLILSLLNLDITKIKNSTNFFNSVEGRGKAYIIKRYKKKFHFIDESYNANPSSVKNAIFNFSKIKKNKSKKYLLLGDMLELGEKSNFYHENLSYFINKSDIDKLFIYGKNAFKTYQKTYKAKQGNILQNINDFDEVFSNLINKNDYLMIKGSNATGLNNLSKKIINGEKYAL